MESKLNLKLEKDSITKRVRAPDSFDDLLKIAKHSYKLVDTNTLHMFYYDSETDANTVENEEDWESACRYAQTKPNKSIKLYLESRRKNTLLKDSDISRAFSRGTRHFPEDITIDDMSA